ncbi:unnamed protein product [Caenorhabditis bovis]|uniref:Uncharacterized protein n=1 Tax=Caenorhabditis bovis TaxID=2654633 RepID=A0A8S1EAJ2_9PELO|nr:unnamed protein product [Caenorhabditis bovis]
MISIQTITRFGQYFGFFGALVFNTIVLTLNYYNAPTSFGTYRYLINAFSIYGIVYGCIEILTLPIMLLEDVKNEAANQIYFFFFQIFHTSGAGILVIVDSVFRTNLIIGMKIISLYCACFCFSLCILSTHFIYRSFSVCRPECLAAFSPRYLWLWLVGCASLSIMWGCICYFFCGPDDVKNKYFGQRIIVYYNIEMNETAYIGPLYYTHNPHDGTRAYRWSEIIATACTYIIISITLKIIFFCGYKTHRKLFRLSGIMSNKSSDINIQLLKTLMWQTAVPMLTIYIPIAFFYFFPLFEIDLGAWMSAVGFGTSLYPALDPFIAIFMIKPFRDAILCRKNRVSYDVGSATIT